MKKLLLVPILLFCFSCKKDTGSADSKDDRSVDSGSSAIVGKWVVVKEDVMYYKNGQQVDKFTYNIPLATAYVTAWYQFNADGTFGEYQYNNASYVLTDAASKYTLINGTLSLFFSKVTYAYTYSVAFIDSNNITLTEPMFPSAITYNVGTTIKTADAEVTIRYFTKN